MTPIDIARRQESELIKKITKTDILLRGQHTIRLLRGRHPRMTLLFRGRLMIRMLRMEPLLLRWRQLRSKIYCSWTHSNMSLTFRHHLLKKAPDTQPTSIILNTIDWEITRDLSIHQCKSPPPQNGSKRVKSYCAYMVSSLMIYIGQ